MLGGFSDMQTSIKLIYSDYAPLLKKLDEDLKLLSQQSDYQQT
jgi:hypothetical protein